ncbi:uncharacterized protein K441DRAFT_665923 [Cenococcum geophilum 1.58]|uniref:uncharacterized protein n=1 Tax=Cenococcum geophilum 1.58 TaxID=794803 RepID=UPI00358F6179|nr:hypothetical protein K441DRAFT_665923 [Cenococcum geophilum 1.58]
MDITGKYRVVLMASPMAFQAVQRRYDLSLGKILEAAAGSRLLSEVLTNLVKQRGSEMKITGKIMMEICHDKRSREAIAQLLKENGGGIKITEAAMHNSILTSDIEMVMVLLDQMTAEFKITEEMLEQAANRSYGKEMMMLLLGRSDIAVKIIKRAVVSVARLCDKELMALVLDQKGAEESITNEALEAAATSREYGKR